VQIIVWIQARPIYIGLPRIPRRRPWRPTLEEPEAPDLYPTEIPEMLGNPITVSERGRIAACLNALDQILSGPVALRVRIELAAILVGQALKAAPT